MKLFKLLFVLLLNYNLFACTTAIISGKVTADGRPLLLKNRDTDVSNLDNRLIFNSEGKFSFIGLVNSGDINNENVWAGYNSAGFAIMNSASYNLKGDDTTNLADMEGIIMKKALMVCATVEEFEKFLAQYPKPLGVEANFGVIDAAGGAAYFETNNYSFKKFDVNDPATAPGGYLIRTNYSFSGAENEGYGYIRYESASSLFRQYTSNNKISFEFLINDVPRCLNHSLTMTNLTSDLPADNITPKYVSFRDYIPRYSTSAAIVVQGVKENESPRLTTMWSVVGFPLTSVIIPVWLLDNGKMPALVQADSSGKAPVCTYALQLKEKALHPRMDSRDNYLNVAVLLNRQNTGIRQQLNTLEQEILSSAKEKLNKWYSNGLNQDEAVEFYKWIDERVTKYLQEHFYKN